MNASLSAASQDPAQAHWPGPLRIFARRRSPTPSEGTEGVTAARDPAEPAGRPKSSLESESISLVPRISAGWPPAGPRRRAERASGRILLILLIFPTLVPAATLTFRDVTKPSGIRFKFKTDLRHGRMISTMGGGVAAADFDGDGWTDLFFTGSAADAFKPEKGPCGRLYRNRGDGSFEDATAKSGIRACGWQMAASWVDIDSDGLPDLIVAGLDKTTVWHNRGDGTFREVSGEWGLVLGHHFTIGAAAGDFDGDGRVDLYFVGYLETSLAHELSFPLFQVRIPEDYEGEDARLFHQRGDGSFEEATASAGVANHGGKGTGAVFFDYDGDGRQDLFVSNDLVSNRLYRNLGGGRFEDVTEQTGAGAREKRARAGMGIAVGDPFLSGYPSLYVTNFSGETNTLYRNVEGQLFDDATEEANAGKASWPYVQWGTDFTDFDDDGYPDLYAVSGHIGRRILAVLSKLFGYAMKGRVWEGDRSYRQAICVWKNGGNGVFEDASATSGDLGKLRVCARGSAAADFDGDGRVDIAVAAISGGSRILRNTTGSANHAIEILPVAGADRRTCLGTKIRVTAGEKRRFRSSSLFPRTRPDRGFLSISAWEARRRRTPSRSSLPGRRRLLWSCATSRRTASTASAREGSRKFEPSADEDPGPARVRSFRAGRGRRGGLETAVPRGGLAPAERDRLALSRRNPRLRHFVPFSGRLSRREAHPDDGRRRRGGGLRRRRLDRSLLREPDSALEERGPRRNGRPRDVRKAVSEPPGRNFRGRDGEVGRPRVRLGNFRDVGGPRFRRIS